MLNFVAGRDNEPDGNGTDFLNYSSYPANGSQKLVEVEDERKLRIFMEKRVCSISPFIIYAGHRILRIQEIYRYLAQRPPFHPRSYSGSRYTNAYTRGNTDRRQWIDGR